MGVIEDFRISAYPKLWLYCVKNYPTETTMGAIMYDLGYKSIVISQRGADIKWYFSENEYTKFLLEWS